MLVAIHNDSRVWTGPLSETGTDSGDGSDDAKSK